MIREINPGAWNVINNAAFNGLQENHFTRTSLHLHFTEYYRPIDLSSRGEQDSRASILESIVSIHDSGTWVADVDVLGVTDSENWVEDDNVSAVIRRGKVGRIASPKSCTCGNTTSFSDLISIECWDEILDLPSAGSVVRVRGSAIARLATATVLAQLRKQKKSRLTILVCPPEGEICLRCNSVHGATIESTVFIY
jgi:hypothetical protein